MWIIIGVGFVFGVVLAPLSIFITTKLEFSFFNRKGLDEATQRYLFNYTWDDLIIDDLFIASYEFNSKLPRFFSKYYNWVDPAGYNFLIREAVAASSSAPFYFEPMKHTNKFGITELLIDGGTICNNPSLYAFIYARNLRGKKKIRMVSLGTGLNKESVNDLGDAALF